MAKEKWFLTGISSASIKGKSLKEKEKNYERTHSHATHRQKWEQ